MNQELTNKDEALVDLQNIIHLTSTLIDILEQENDSLRSFNLANLEGLHERKSSITETLSFYNQNLKKSHTQDFEQSQKDTLNQLQNTLKNISEENIKLLHRAILLNQKIIAKIKDAYLKEANAVMGYNKLGAFAQKFKTYSEAPHFTVKNYI